MAIALCEYFFSVLIIEVASHDGSKTNFVKHRHRNRVLCVNTYYDVLNADFRNLRHQEAT